MIHTHHQPPAPSSAAGGDCGNCGAHLRGLLHYVRLRGIQRRVCTSCVLRLHPSSFCPVCFAFYDSNPPHPSKRFACSKCASFTHSHCVASPPPPYLCPPCSAPSPASFTFFRNDATAADGGVRRIDGKSAAVLLCAAKIASASMAKAVAVAKIEAEKKAKDAALARKRALEALERVARLITKNNFNAARNNGGGDGSAQLSGSGASFFISNMKQNVNVSRELVNNVKNETG